MRSCESKVLGGSRLETNQTFRQFCIHLVPVLFPLIFVNVAFVQKMKTHVIRKCVNPEWNEDLTFSIEDPTLPMKLVCLFSLTLYLNPLLVKSE